MEQCQFIVVALEIAREFGLKLTFDLCEYESSSNKTRSLNCQKSVHTRDMNVHNNVQYRYR